MPYFVTGATGFIGRHLVPELLDRRDGDIYVLVREGSEHKIEALIRQWQTDRVIPVTGDLSADKLGVSHQWVTAHKGEIDHFFHVAAIYDLTASDELNERLNVGGTRQAVTLAADLEAGCLHQVSSVAVAGNYRGVFDESMFDEGQRLPSPYHRTKFESEKIVREESTVPWRVYRPSIVVGHSETGAMDKVDGFYYLFPLVKLLRTLPAPLPMLGVDLGDTNVVPVDYVAKAIDHLAHAPDGDGDTYHLVNPEPQSTTDILNLFMAAARAPQFSAPIDRRITAMSPTKLLPRRFRPATMLGAALNTAPVQFALDQTIGRFGVPAEVLSHASFPSVFSASATEKALRGSGIYVPDLESYAGNLWSYWEDYLDDAIKSDKSAVAALSGKTIVITGASSGIGLVTAVRVAKAGGIPILVARGKDKLDATQQFIESQGGTARAYACDLSDLEAIDALTTQLSEDFEHIDFVVNNAGRSIRRSLKLSEDRFHDFERTMQLNYFGAIRLIIGLLPKMRAQKSGHVVNISSIGVQTSPPRFSAYVASKAALDAWSNVVSSELVGNGISFTSIHMPLVRTPMIAPTKLYDKFPTISPGQAADKVIDAMVHKPHHINTALGTAGAVAQTLTPKAAHRVLNMAYHVFPDSTAAKGGEGGGRSEGEQILLARIFKGIYW